MGSGEFPVPIQQHPAQPPGEDKNSDKCIANYGTLATAGGPGQGLEPGDVDTRSRTVQQGPVRPPDKG